VSKGVAVLLSVSLALMLAGCSSIGLGNSDYDCKGYPQGVNCKSAREVYELTNYRDSLETESGKDKAPNCPECQEKSFSDPHVLPAAAASTQAVQGLGYAGPLPLRSAARIMRVWIAPWESMDGALHLPTYLYAEVVERRWSIGEGKMKVAPRITPLMDVSPPSSPGKSERPPVKRRVKGRPKDLSDLGPPKINPNPAPALDLSRSKIAPKNSFFNRQTGQVNLDNY
jgi:conjugal transfer pilus assembly protein TraV